VTSEGTAFVDELVALGFRQGSGRRGEVIWNLAINRFLTIYVHEQADSALVTWSCGLGDFVEERGWRLSVTDTSTAELYPQRDVQIPQSGEALRGEIARVMQQLRLDLGSPESR
jgi:hypothetical protein